MSEPSSSGFQPNLFTGCMPFILGPSGLGLAGTLTCNRLWMLYLCVFFLLPSELVHLVESLKQPMRVQIFTLRICICNIGLCDFHCPHSFISCNFAFVMSSTSFQNICTSWKADTSHHMVPFSSRVAAALLTCLYLGVLYGIYVPTWQFEAPEATSSMDINGFTANISLLQVIHFWYKPWTDDFW